MAHPWAATLIEVAELDLIAEARLNDGKALYAAGLYDSASYLCRYAIEVSLKARICRTLNWKGFPNTSSEWQFYRSFQTHDLEVLLKLAGQEDRIKKHHFTVWSAVTSWKSYSRYNKVGTVKREDAELMIHSVEQLLSAI